MHQQKLRKQIKYGIDNDHMCSVEYRLPRKS